MKVTLDTANDSTAGNPPKLSVSGVVFSDRAGVEKFIAHLKVEMNQLWPKKKDPWDKPKVKT